MNIHENSIQHINQMGGVLNIGSGNGQPMSPTINLMGASMGRSMGASMGRSMGASMGRSMGASMGRSMGVSMGKSMGASLGASLGQIPKKQQSVTQGILKTSKIPKQQNVNQMAPVINAASKKIKFYNQDQIKDPYAQISNSGFTPIGNMKIYDVANMYDRAEPTNLRDLPEVYTVPYSTTPFLGNNTTSIKYVDDDSMKLRYPVFQNRKSAIGTSQVTINPGQVFINNPKMSSAMNTFYEQATTINLLGHDDQTFSTALDPTKISLGQKNYGQDTTRYINRWNIVDPRVVQNVDHIVMNMKNSEGHVISLHQCGLSTRNELRNYVEVNNC